MVDERPNHIRWADITTVILGRYYLDSQANYTPTNLIITKDWLETCWRNKNINTENRRNTNKLGKDN